MDQETTDAYHAGFLREGSRRIGDPDLSIKVQVLHFERMLTDAAFLNNRFRMHGTKEMESGLSHTDSRVRQATRAVFSRLLHFNAGQYLSDEEMLLGLVCKVLALKNLEAPDAQIETLELLREISKKLLGEQKVLRNRIENSFADYMTEDKPEALREAAQRCRDLSREEFVTALAPYSEALQYSLETGIVNPLYRTERMLEFHRVTTLHALEQKHLKSDDLVKWIAGEGTESTHPPDRILEEELPAALDKKHVPEIRRNALLIASEAFKKGFITAAQASKILVRGLADRDSNVLVAAQDLQAALT